MKLTIKDNNGNSAGELEVQFPLVEDGKGTQAVHDTVVAYQAAQRSGTASTKNVGEVTGTQPLRKRFTQCQLLRFARNLFAKITRLRTKHDSTAAPKRLRISASKAGTLRNHSPRSRP